MVTALPPSAIPQLAKVLKGLRRIRTHGIFYGVKRIEEVMACPLCNEVLLLIPRWVYEEALRTKLDLRIGNKFGERAPPIQHILPGFDHSSGIGFNFGH